MDASQPRGRRVPVCPRCGQKADGASVCVGCGLELRTLAELPTRTDWEAEQGKAQDLADPRRGASKSRLLLPALIVAGALLLAGGAVAASLLNRGDDPSPAASDDPGSEDTTGSARYSALEQRVGQELLDRVEGPKLGQLQNLADVECKRIGSSRGGEELRCVFLTDMGEQGEPLMYIVTGNEIGRVSNGGESPSPPADAEDATNRLRAAAEQSFPGGDQIVQYVCQETNERLAFQCLSMSARGWSATTKTTFNDNGTIADTEILFASDRPY